MSCERCSSSVEPVILNKEFGNVELCDYCFKRFHHRLEGRRARRAEKDLVAEQKLLKRFIKRNGIENTEIIGALFMFIVFVIIIIYFYRAN